MSRVLRFVAVWAPIFLFRAGPAFAGDGDPTFPVAYADEVVGTPDERAFWTRFDDPTLDSLVEKGLKKPVFKTPKIV